MFQWTRIRARALALVRTSRSAQIMIAAFFVLVSGLAIASSRADIIKVHIDNKTVSIVTFRRTVGGALAHTSLGIYPEDIVTPSRDTAVSRGLVIQVKRSVPLELNIDGQVIQGRSAQNNVGDALREMSDHFGLQLKDVDEASLPSSNKLISGMEITVHRAVPIEVVVDGKKLDTELAPGSVDNVLSRLRITLADNDKLSLPRDHVIKAGDKLQVVRVTEAEETIRTELPYQTVAQAADFPVGLPDQIVKHGSNGLQEQTIKLTYEDGKEVNREVLAQRVVRAPVNQIVSRGSQTTVSRGGKLINFKRAYIMRATAYSDPGGVTAVGSPVQWGVVAVDPRVIPLGSKLYIDGYGEATALDTGSAIKGNRIDLYMDSENTASAWGVRSIVVYVQ